MILGQDAGRVGCGKREEEDGRDTLGNDEVVEGNCMTETRDELRCRVAENGIS